MNKTAVIYDKWLHSLGGGEVVACNMAKILKENGYDVTFICGKKISLLLIKNKLGIDLSDIKFITVWNDDLSLKELVQHKDLFINASFIDYSFAHAKKNIYYTHFPTKPYSTLKSIILNKFIYPNLSKIMKPMEFITEPKMMTMVNNRFAYSLDRPIDIAFSYLEIDRDYQVKFSIFFESFCKNLLENFHWEIKNANIVSDTIKIDHHHNVAHFLFNIKAMSSSIYLHMGLIKKYIAPSNKSRVYLLNPRLLPTIPLSEYLFKRFHEKLNEKLRSGIFVDPQKRLNGYQLFVTHSQFVKKWINNYWKKDAIALYPPVDLLFKKYQLSNVKKNNWICSVGRFFTLGHGKKQEVLVEAFKKLYNLGYKNWQLHLVGGLGKEPSSIKFIHFLKKEAKGYPIYFHLNVNRDKVEKIILKSKIYWHATGFGENEDRKPIRFEHFGIAPIEALSAGCIPVLYNGGGLREIITLLNLDSNRYLFKTTHELVKKTMQIVNEKKLSLDWKKLFDLLSLNFSYETFAKRFMGTVKSV